MLQNFRRNSGMNIGSGLEFYVPQSGSALPTFRDNIFPSSVPGERFTAEDGTRRVVPKRQYVTTNIRRVKSRNSAHLSVDKKPNR